MGGLFGVASKTDCIMDLFYGVDYHSHLGTRRGAGLGVWGVVNLLEGYGSDNPGSKSQGMKQLMAGGGIIVIGTTLIPLLSGLLHRERAGDALGAHHPDRNVLL